MKNSMAVISVNWKHVIKEKNKRMIQMKEWRNEVLKGKKRLSIPIMTHPGIELCGKTAREAQTNGQAHAHALIKLNGEYTADGRTGIMALNVEAAAFWA